ncbi:MAG: histidine phosphatase family protein [Firmicutes bacterium]|nr:histidine phosphatase family protein [Bacillota bacterium]
MGTTIYLIRHSEPFKVHRGSVRTNETILLENEKSPLSIQGEKMAEVFATIEEFKNLNLVYSSNYVRAMSTAKYFASINELKVNIDDRFNERIHGVNSWGELPNNFESKQFEDENYKLGFGESQKEVQNRMYEVLCEIINQNQGKRIAIVTHSTAMAFLLKKWCKVYYNKEYTFRNKILFDGKWKYLETFKLTFDENNDLICVENIKQ